MMSKNINNLCITIFFIVIFASFLILYQTKPIWVTKKKDDKNVIYYPLLVLYSFLFASLFSIIILLSYSNKGDFSVNQVHVKSSFLSNNTIYA